MRPQAPLRPAPGAVARLQARHGVQRRPTPVSAEGLA
jgi:hypothetical protein